MSQSNTLLKISAIAWKEIAEKLRNAGGFEDSFEVIDLQEIIDMRGISIVSLPEVATATVGEGPAIVIEAGPIIEGVLKEMEEAYSLDKYPNPTPEESRRIRDAYPKFIERLSAFQGRHLVEMLRSRLKNNKT
jgi:hypothetical protein